jgi:hypothetical protein
MNSEPDESLPLGDPPLIEHLTPNGVTEISQRLIPFPFTPPDVRLDDKEALSTSNDWFTKHDNKKIDELDSLDFYPSSGPQSCSVILIAIVHVFGRNFPWRFGAIWPKLIESQINRNG